MAIRLREDGAIYPCIVKDRKLIITFAPDLVVEHPLTIVKEDFEISHSFPVCNTCMVCESKSSGNLIVAFFTGELRVYSKVDNKFRMLAASSFNINEIMQQYFDVFLIGRTKQEISDEDMKYSDVYYMREYVFKENPNKWLIDTADTYSPVVIDADKNSWFVVAVAAGNVNTPVLLRHGDKLFNMDESMTLSDPYYIEQPNKWSMNL